MPPIPVPRAITRPCWDYRRGCRVRQAYQVTEANETSATRFDDLPTTYSNAAEMVEECWPARTGITRGVVGRMMEQLETQRSALENRANCAIASRVLANEPAAISLLIEADATTEYSLYRGGTSSAEVREILDRRVGIFATDVV